MKKVTLDNVFGVQSFKDGATQIGSFKMKDDKTYDSAGLLLPRQLEYISSILYKKLYAMQTFLSLGITVNNEGGYADTITSLREETKGDFTEVGKTGNSGTGKITLSGDSSTIKVVGYEADSEFSDIQAGQYAMTNRNLMGSLMGGHTERYAHKIDDIGYKGLFDAGYTSITSSKLFSAMTPTEMLKELKDLMNLQHLVDNDEAQANVMVLPKAIHSQISTTHMDNLSSLITVKEALLKLFPELMITHTVRTTTEIVIFSNNPSCISYRIPMPLEMSTPFRKNWDTEFKGRFRIAGVDLLIEESGYYLEGVA